MDVAFAGLPKQLETQNHRRAALDRLPIDICENHNFRKGRKKVCLNWSTSAPKGVRDVASKTIRRPQSEPLFFYTMYNCQLLDYDCWVWGVSLLKISGPRVVLRPVRGQKDYEVMKRNALPQAKWTAVHALWLPFRSRTTASYHISRVLSRPIK